MWTLDHPLSFPSLVSAQRGPVQIVHKGKTGLHKTNKLLYKLDWRGHDERLRKAHDRLQLKLHGQDEGRRIVPYFENCPQEYTEKLQNLRFALDANYLSEIKRMVFRAQEEWTLYRPFDTSVRDHCLRPATEFIHCAFYLLSDCMYNEEKKYWVRKRGFYAIVLNAMLYKFWYNQTGGGWIEYKADIPKLRESLKDPERMFFDTTAEEMQEIRDWVAAVDEHQQGMKKIRDEYYTFKGNFEGVSEVREEK